MNRTKSVKKASPPWRLQKLIIFSSQSNNEGPIRKRLSRNKSKIIKNEGIDTQKNQWYSLIFDLVIKWRNIQVPFRRRIFNIFRNKLHYMSSNTYFFQIKVVRAKFENMTFLWTPLIYCVQLSIPYKTKHTISEQTRMLYTWKRFGTYQYFRSLVLDTLHCVYEVIEIFTNIFIEIVRVAIILCNHFLGNTGLSWVKPKNNSELWPISGITTHI